MSVVNKKLDRRRVLSAWMAGARESKAAKKAESSGRIENSIAEELLRRRREGIYEQELLHTCFGSMFGSFVSVIQR